MRPIVVSTCCILAICPSAAAAQLASAPVQRIGVAEVALSKGCESYSSRMPLFEDGSTEASNEAMASAGAFVPILGGILGDVAGAGLNALATALESASQAKAYGAEGRANFEFYTLNPKSPSVAVPRLGTELDCLSIEVPGEHFSDSDGRANWPPPGYEVVGTKVRALGDDKRVTDQQIAELTQSFALPASPPALRIEAEIIPMRDGLYLRPVYIHYATRIPGAPASKALPAELHVSLATPTAVKDGAATENVFAIARIPLPKLKPGDTWWAEQITAQSDLLPYRPEDGATAALKAALASGDAYRKGQEDLAAAEVQVAHAVGVRFDGRQISGCVEINCPSYLSAYGDFKKAKLADLVEWAKRPKSKLPEARRKALDEAEQLYASRILTIDESLGRLRNLGGRDMPTAGSTTVEARIVLTRSANQFGLAVAKALKKQEAPLAAAVSGAITKDDPAWTQARSDLAVAKLTVTHKEQALARAKAKDGGDDAEAIEKAELALLEAKMDANLKAAALDQSIPYPEAGR